MTADQDHAGNYDHPREVGGSGVTEPVVHRWGNSGPAKVLDDPGARQAAGSKPAGIWRGHAARPSDRPGDGTAQTPVRRQCCAYWVEAVPYPGGGCGRFRDQWARARKAAAISSGLRPWASRTCRSRRALQASRWPPRMSPRLSRSFSEPGKLYVASKTGPGGEDRGDSGCGVLQGGHEVLGNVAGSERGDDESVARLGHRGEEGAVVAERRGVQADAGRRVGQRFGESGAGGERGVEVDAALVEASQGAGGRGGERGRAGAVGLADGAGRVDLVAEDDHGAGAGQLGSAAVMTAAWMFAGPSAPGWVGSRIAPVTTIG